MDENGKTTSDAYNQQEVGELDYLYSKEEFEIEWTIPVMNIKDSKKETITTVEQKVSQKLYLFKKKQSFLVEGADSLAQLGGFAVSMYIFYGIFARCVNRRLMLRNIVEDTFLVRNNSDILPHGKKSRGKGKASAKKKPAPKAKGKGKKKELEEVQEESDEESESEEDEGGEKINNQYYKNDYQFEGGRSRQSTIQDIEEARSQASKKSGKSTQSQRSQISKGSGPLSPSRQTPGNRSQVYKETPKSKPKKKDIPRRSPDDYMNIKISTISLFATCCIPSCCRTSYQKAVGKLL